MPQVSIVLPYRGDTKLFEQTLVSVLQNRPADCEIIVPHANYQDPYELEGEVEFVAVDKKTRLNLQLDAAIRVSNSEIVHCLTPGLEVTEGWCDWSVAHFQDPYIGSVVPLIVDADDRVVSAGLKPDFFLRKKYVGSGGNRPQKLNKLNPVGPTSLAGFYRKSALDQIGSVSDFGETTLDLDVALALKEIGFETKLELDSLIKLDERRQDSVGAIRTGIDMQNSIWRFSAPDGFGKSLLISAGASLFELSTAIFQPEKLLRLFGRMIAMKDCIRGSKFHQLLESATGPELNNRIRRAIKSEHQGASDEPSRRAA